MKDISIGDKFYISTEGDVIIIRIKRIVNEDKYQVYLDNRPDRLFNISYNKLMEYTRLKPYGYLFFSIMTLQDNNKDVAISFFRREDENRIPFAVCRQNMENIYLSKAKMLDKYESPIFDIGVSISQDTCPEEIPFDMVLACNNVTLSSRISIYLDDKFSDIISIIPKKNKYDSILSSLYLKLKDTNFRGVNENIESLIANTGFMDDICRGFNIKLFDGIIEYNHDSFELNPEQRIIIEKELNVEMFRTYVNPYSYNINLSEIKRSYVLIKDITETVYIVAYDKGEYLNSDFRKDFRAKLDIVETCK